MIALKIITKLKSKSEFSISVPGGKIVNFSTDGDGVLVEQTRQMFRIEESIDNEDVILITFEFNTLSYVYYLKTQYPTFNVSDNKLDLNTVFVFINVFSNHHHLSYPIHWRQLKESVITNKSFDISVVSINHVGLAESHYSMPLLTQTSPPHLILNTFKLPMELMFICTPENNAKLSDFLDNVVISKLKSFMSVQSTSMDFISLLVPFLRSLNGNTVSSKEFIVNEMDVILKIGASTVIDYIYLWYYIIVYLMKYNLENFIPYSDVGVFRCRVSNDISLILLAEGKICHVMGTSTKQKLDANTMNRLDDVEYTEEEQELYFKFKTPII